MSVTNVNESASELQSAAEPLHITAAGAKLATLRDTMHLPHPVGVRFHKPNAIAVVDVSTFGEVSVWAQALGVPYAPTSSAHTDGSSTHSVWVQWHGWDLRVVAHVDAPVVPAEPELVPAGCAGHSVADDCPNHVFRSTATSWGEWPS